MLVRIILGFSAILLLASPGTAQDCQTLPQEGREEVLRKAPTCDKAMELFSDCAYGASGDISLGQIITKKCEATFLSKLSARQKHSYDRGMKRCYDQYKNEDGTMYRAMTAGCQADLAQNYTHKFGKAPKR
jgi:hypothetical protein